MKLTKDDWYAYVIVPDDSSYLGQWDVTLTKEEEAQVLKAFSDMSDAQDLLRQKILEGEA